MSDPVLEALEQRAKGARSSTPSASDDDVLNALNERAQGRLPQEDTADQRFTGIDAMKMFTGGVRDWFSASPATGLVELAGQGVTAAGSKILSGLAGIGTVAGNVAGLTDADPASVVRGTQEALTYQPRSSSAHMMSGALDKALHIADPLMAPVERKLDEIHPEIVPTIAAAGEAALDIAPLAGGLKAARGARTVAPGEAPAAPSVAESSTNPFARESMGAAATAPNMTTLSPELRVKIEEATRTGQPLDRDTLSRHIEADQLPIRMQLSPGQATQDPVRLSVEQNARGKHPELARFYNGQNQALIDNLDEIRAQVSPSVVGQDHIQNGQALIDLYKSIDEPRRTEIRAAYEALDNAAGGHFPLDAKTWAANTNKALKEARKSRFLPSSLEAELNDFADGARMSFRDFEEMRTTLAAEARKAERSGDGNAARAIAIMRDELEAIPMTAGTEPLKNLADRARTLARERFRLIENDPAYAAAIDDGVEIGAPSPLADTFAEKYVVRGKAAHLDRMQANLSSDPVGQELISAAALNYLKKRAGIDLYNNSGNFSQAGFNRALSNDVLPRARQLLPPETSDMLERLGNVARYTQAQPRGSFVNNSNTTVAAAAMNIAKGAAERTANAVVPGAELGTLARERAAKRAEKQFVRETLEPGGGITLNKLLSQKEKKK